MIEVVMVISQVLLIRHGPGKCHIAGFIEYVHVIFKHFLVCDLFIFCNSRGIMRDLD
jgi:hypothetical protein